MNDNKDIKRALETIAHSNLYKLAQAVPKEVGRIPNISKESPETAIQENTQSSLNCTEEALSLAYDLPSNLVSAYRERGQRLNVSMRKLKDAKNELISKKLAIEIWAGKTLFLAPTKKLYQGLGLSCPYKRSVSDEHSFLVLLVQRLIEATPQIQKTEIEAANGTPNRPIDLVAYQKNGLRIAYELTLSCSNVAGNLAKLQGKGFAEICFVCRDHYVRESTWTILRDAGFDPDFFTTVRCTIISSLIRESRNLKLEERQ